jgi:hypothetical protein
MLGVAVGVADQERVGMQRIVGLPLQIVSVEMGWAEVYWTMEST